MNRDQPSSAGLVFLAARVADPRPVGGAAVTELNPNGTSAATQPAHLPGGAPPRCRCAASTTPARSIARPSRRPATALDNGIFLRANGTIWPSPHSGAPFPRHRLQHPDDFRRLPAGNITDGTTQTATGTWHHQRAALLSVGTSTCGPSISSPCRSPDHPAGYPVPPTTRCATTTPSTPTWAAATRLRRHFHRLQRPPGGRHLSPASGTLALEHGDTGRREHHRIVPGTGRLAVQPVLPPCGAISGIPPIRSRPVPSAIRQLPNTVTTTTRIPAWRLSNTISPPRHLHLRLRFVIGSPVSPTTTSNCAATRVQPLPFNITVLGLPPSTVPCPLRQRGQCKFHRQRHRQRRQHDADPGWRRFSIAAGTPTASVRAQVGTVSASASPWGQ